MPDGDPPDASGLLDRASAGDEGAAGRLLELVYEQLRALAASYLRGERAGHTLQPTALVHEAFLRLQAGSPVRYQNHTHFFAVAARAMRQVLVDHARRRAAAKRGGDPERVTLDDGLQLGGDAESRVIDVLALDEALERLGKLDERQARVVELRFFGGLTIDEAARVLEVSTDTVEDDWAMARAWLKRTLSCR